MQDLRQCIRVVPSLRNEAGPFVNSGVAIRSPSLVTDRVAGPQNGFRWVHVFLLWSLLSLGAAVAHAQLPGQGREYPPNEYYLSFRLIDQGDFVKAMQAFRSAARGGIRTSEGQWVDAICYHAMIGECYFQMGDLAQALDQFTSSQQLLLAHGQWMLRVEFPATIEPRNTTPRNPVTWGASSRRTVAGRFPNRYPILQGQPDPLNQIRQGGVFALPEFFLINAHEVLRCGAHAIRRRGEILGKTSAHDPLNEKLLTLLTARPAPPNHWSQAWVDALLGMTYSVTGRSAEAVTELTKSLQIAGQFDHPLTAMALQQLGRIAFQQGQYEAAAKYFFEASVSAAWFEQSDLMEEAFRWGTLSHLAGGAKGVNPILEPALGWARRERSQLLEASLLVQEAHNLLELNETTAATALLEQARRAMNRTEMVKGYVGSRFNYASSLAAFQSGNLAAGESAWNAVMAFQTNSQKPASLRLFEINLVHALATARTVTPRVANELYSDVLREPNLTDWTTNLVETLTVSLAPHMPAHEHWLAVARERGEIERTMEIADRIRRLRFFSTLAMGGRLLALGWNLEAPKETLTDRQALLRQDLLVRYPKYAAASQVSAQLREQISKLPLVAEDAVALKKQQQLFTELATISQTQEVMLRELALRREPAEFMMPPALDFKAFQAKLSPKQAVLAFLITSKNEMYGFLIKKSDYTEWRVEGANKIGKDLTELLKQLGQFDRNATVDLALLQSDSWKPLAADLWKKITDGLKPESLQGIEELILVPDRWLWYVPFEALPMEEGDFPSLLTRIPLRYSPTVSLALPDGRSASVPPELVVMTAKSAPTGGPITLTETVSELKKVLGNVIEFPGSLPIPSSFFAAFCRRVVVFDDVDPIGKGPYDWHPFALDREKNGAALSGWLALPWGAPDQLVLPGYHTSAETALKRVASGDELFLAACAFRACGSRTILLSRWRTGGQTSLDLVREFVQESPYTTAASAWQRSVQLLMEKDLNISREPRIKAGSDDGSLRSSHPFLWSGYVLIDSGVVPIAEPKK